MREGEKQLMQSFLIQQNACLSVGGSLEKAEQLNKWCSLTQRGQTLSVCFSGFVVDEEAASFDDVLLNSTASKMLILEYKYDSNSEYSGNAVLLSNFDSQSFRNGELSFCRSV